MEISHIKHFVRDNNPIRFHHYYDGVFYCHVEDLETKIVYEVPIRLEPSLIPPTLNAVDKAFFHKRRIQQAIDAGTLRRITPTQEETTAEIVALTAHLQDLDPATNQV